MAAVSAALFARIDDFVSQTREAVWVRRADNLLLIRPEKTLGVNESAADILSALYSPERRGAEAALTDVARRYRTPLTRIAEDAAGLIETVGALMREDFSERPHLKRGPYDRGLVKYPVLAEIALTYACQNRCVFCYASSPARGERGPVMKTDEVRQVMDRIFHEAHVPSLSFTGGEATLRRDLPELVRHGADLGMRVNLITNGVRAADAELASRLVDEGLASAQVSLEAADAELHDRLVGREGAFLRTVSGVRNFQRLGIHVHTNTTLCRENLDHAPQLMRFVREELGLRTLSMNLLIRTGEALDSGSEPVSYAEIAERLPALVELAKEIGLHFVWYSPVPYCLVNPVLLGQGAKACACVDGILSVNPAGEVLPCSSFEQGLGSLLTTPYERIRNSRRARYWRERHYLPPVCEDCEDADVCAGACPLYWDATDTFSELPRAGATDHKQRARWEKRRRKSGAFGVRSPREERS